MDGAQDQGRSASSQNQQPHTHNTHTHTHTTHNPHTYTHTHTHTITHSHKHAQPPIHPVPPSKSPFHTRIHTHTHTHTHTHPLSHTHSSHARTHAQTHWRARAHTHTQTSAPRDPGELDVAGGAVCDDGAQPHPRRQVVGLPAHPRQENAQESIILAIMDYYNIIIIIKKITKKSAGVEYTGSIACVGVCVWVSAAPPAAGRRPAGPRDGRTMCGIRFTAQIVAAFYGENHSCIFR